MQPSPWSRRPYTTVIRRTRTSNAGTRRAPGCVEPPDLPAPLAVERPCEESRRTLIDLGYGVGVDLEGGGAAAAVAEAVGCVAEVDAGGQEFGGAVVA